MLTYNLSPKKYQVLLENIPKKLRPILIYMINNCRKFKIMYFSQRKIAEHLHISRRTVIRHLKELSGEIGSFKRPNKTNIYFLKDSFINKINPLYSETANCHTNYKEKIIKERYLESSVQKDSRTQSQSFKKIQKLELPIFEEIFFSQKFSRKTIEKAKEAVLLELKKGKIIINIPAYLYKTCSNINHNIKNKCRKQKMAPQVYDQLKFCDFLSEKDKRFFSQYPSTKVMFAIESFKTYSRRMSVRNPGAFVNACLQQELKEPEEISLEKLAHLNENKNFAKKFEEEFMQFLRKNQIFITTTAGNNSLFIDVGSPCHPGYEFKYENKEMVHDLNKFLYKLTQVFPKISNFSANIKKEKCA